ncbi:TonB-dependent siderophore receptor [Shewanella baltica]|uniref:TonB-dependent siderophore receptor n=1 Tax=Shewanella baltica TaxID=62322 RepID=UPI000E07EFD9|nr:TonB-dependent siderophore receptor [Shewanella baltica]SUI50285.1 Outer-membrane receptor for Fe(III)-coprogen, Fe(III)-ferrioxamine B and Fe(III)-rhodotrulic acid [Shewanella baltica]
MELKITIMKTFPLSSIALVCRQAIVNPKLLLCSAMLASVPHAVADTVDADGKTKKHQKEIEIINVIGAKDLHDNRYKTQAMNTATGLDLSYLETPQSVTSITRQMMNDQQLNSVIDAMTSVAGINARPMDNDRYSISARGIAVTSILYDGVPTTYDTRFNYGDNLIDTAIYERVEVVRGATGLMTGAGNPSAAINLIRKRPTQEFMGSTSVSVGSWNNVRGMVDLSSGLNDSGSVRGRVVAAYQDKDSFQDRYEQQRTTLYGIVETDIGDSTLFTLGVDYQDATPSGTMSGGLPLFYSDGSRTNYDRATSTAPDWGSAHTQGLNTFASLEHRFDNGWNLKGTYTYGDNSLEFDVLWAMGYPDPVTNIGATAGSIAYVDGSRTQHNVDLRAEGQFQLFGQEHQLMFGWNGQRQEFANPYYYPTAAVPPLGDFRDPNFQYPKPQWQDTSDTGSSGETKQSAAYVATQLNLSDALAVLVGLRLNEWETDQDNFKSLYNFNISNELTTYFGLTYALTEQYSLYASYTDIFAPQTKQRIDKSYLDPVKGKNYEGGIKASLFDEALDMSLSVFEIKQDNIGVDTRTRIPGTTIPVYREVDGTNTRGFEFEATGKITDDWNVYLGYTQFTTEDPKGKRINTTSPRQQLKLFTTYTFGGDWHKLQIGAGVNWQSRVYQDADKPVGNGIDTIRVEVEQGSYALASLMASYAFTEQLKLSANLHNALDKSYYSQVGQYSQFQYGTPRSASLTLDYRF